MDCYFHEFYGESKVVGSKYLYVYKYNKEILPFAKNNIKHGVLTKEIVYQKGLQRALNERSINLTV